MYKPHTHRGVTDITMVTVFTMERVAVFERLVQTWGAPLHAVFYGNEEEVQQFDKFYHSSPVLSGARNVAVHVVYSREVWLPIYIY